jgi:hypothetical protein
MVRKPELPPISEEQLLYARILEVGVLLGLGMLLITFGLYVLGIVEPAVPVHDLPRYWTLNVHDYLEAINRDHLHREHLVIGWSWVTALRFGDYLNFLGIVLLAMVTVVCYLGILPTLLRKRDWAYSCMAVLEAFILSLAASGLLQVGH